MSQKMFNSEVEVGMFLGSIHVIQDAYRAISQTSSTYQLHTSPSGIKVLAFNCLSDYTIPFRKGEDLVSSDNHKVVEFISTKVNPKISINKAAVELFELHFNELSKLSNQLINDQLVVTGCGLAGYLAILYTLLHQHYADLKESKGSKTAKRPICVTFGSPLIGNQRLQGAISERPQWKSSFLNVVAKTDLLASFFSSNSQYKPFGTFLFCTESGGHTAFEDQDAILAVLDAMVSPNAGNYQMHDYSKELGSIRKTVLYRGGSKFNESNLSPLRAGIVFQFQEIGALNDISNDLIEKMEKKQTKMIIKSRNVYEPTKKLNDMKIILTYIEWYMKTRRLTGGYYDSYKNAESTNELKGKNEAIIHQLKLNQYWKKTVEENDLVPQKEGAKLRKRWLYAGTNYRRIVEPLDIADHYKRRQQQPTKTNNQQTNKPTKMIARVAFKRSLLSSTTRVNAASAMRPLAMAQQTRQYHENVIDHYENPRNVGSLDKNSDEVGTGLVGAPACGDVMKLQIRVDENGTIIESKFKTFGCGSAIASSSVATEWLKGKTVEECLNIKNTDIASHLKLPPVKLHCSMLAEDAIKAAIGDYKKKQAAKVSA